MPRLAEEGAAFERPMASLGVRYVFPPHGEQHETFQVRVETWPQDQRSIWLENSSSYTTPLAVADVPQIADRLAADGRHVVLVSRSEAPLKDVQHAIEQAGGRASTGVRPVLEVQPEGLHQRIGFVFGSKEEVERIERYHHEPVIGGEQDELPLFHARSLFRDTEFAQ